MDDFEARKRELIKPLLIEAGAALCDCQQFEFGITLLLYHFSRLGTKGLDPADILLILDNKAKKTAGQLIVMLKKHLAVSAGIEEALEEGLAERNFLIHRALIDNAERFVKAETRNALIKEIRKARGKVQKADKMLRPFILGLSAALDGVEHSKIEMEIRDLLS